MELLLFNRLFGDLRHNLLPMGINIILLLLSNKGMSRLSPRPFCAVGIIFRVGRAWKVKIIMLLLVIQVHIILFYLIEGLISILHVLWGRTLDYWASLRWNHWSCTCTKMSLLHILKIIYLHLPINTLFENPQSSTTILISIWWNRSASQFTRKVLIWVQDLWGLVGFGLTS